MPTTDQDWARAYAKQALSDLDAREILAESNAKKCHRLHFLQMAAEKAVKAFLTTQNGHENVRNTHGYVAKHLPRIAIVFYGREGKRLSSHEIDQIRRIAVQVQVLAPACGDEGGNVRLDNSEYPWDDGRGNIQVPCEHNFPNIDDGSKMLIKLIRLIRAASESYLP